MTELRCRDIAKAYGDRPVLSDVDLLVPDGTLTAILGASGSGKTTLLRLVIGFIEPDGGEISLGGHVVARGGGTSLAPDKRAVGYVAQEGALFPHLTVAENIVFGLPRAQRRSGARVGEMLDLVALERSYADRRPNELSGGEQRRVALARALAPRPRVVLLDEPFSGLDAALRTETRQAVVDALAGEGATALLVTHDQAEALSMGHEVAVLRAGRLVQTAAPTVLYRSPVDVEVARFVGEAVVLPGRARGGRVACALGELALADASAAPAEGSSVEVMLRPEQLRLAANGAAAAGGGVAAKVVGHRYYGAETLVQLELADGERTPVSARTFDQETPPAGEQVNVTVAGAAVVYPLAQAAQAAQEGDA